MLTGLDSLWLSPEDPDHYIFSHIKTFICTVNTVYHRLQSLKQMFLLFGFGSDSSPWIRSLKFTIFIIQFIFYCLNIIIVNNFLITTISPAITNQIHHKYQVATTVLTVTLPADPRHDPFPLPARTESWKTSWSWNIMMLKLVTSRSIVLK